MTGTVAFEVPAIVLRRAQNLGLRGHEWLANLPSVVEALADEWDLAIGAVRDGGSEALVVEATMADGTAAILKLGLPGSESGRREARVLEAAGGRGYARLFRSDESHQAMLMERLGAQLSELDLPVEQQIRVILATLAEAWKTPVPAGSFLNGAQKATDLTEFISELWAALDHPCSKAVIVQALAFAERRRMAWSPATAVLAHGDGHEMNTLLVPGSDPPRFKFIDPDGLWIEPAYDLGILMRGMNTPLLDGDALKLGRQRARLLSQLTGIPEQPIWEWGFIERVSTGLLLKQLGVDAASAEFLEVAERWAKESSTPR